MKTSSASLLLAAWLGLQGGLPASPWATSPAGTPEEPEQRLRKFELRGQLESAPGVRLKRMFSQVSLRGADHPIRLSTITDLNGRFKFKKVPEGTYIITVLTPSKRTSTRTIQMTPSFADSKGRIRTSILISPAVNSEAHQVSVAELAVPEKARKEYRKAQAQLAQDRTENAVKHLKRALSIAPAYPAALNNLGTISFHAGKYQEAREHFEKALEIDPTAYSPLVNLGGVLSSMGLFGEALEINLKAVQRRPLDPLAHSQLGITYEGLQQLDKAVAGLREAKRLEPSHFSHPQLALGRIFLKQGLVEDAVREFSEFVSLHPDSPSVAAAREFLARASARDQN